MIEHKTRQAFDVIGLSVRTASHLEVSPETARIEKLWDRFFSDSIITRVPNILDTERIYGVYSDYDIKGDTVAYTVTAGVRVSDLAEIPAGLSGIHVPTQYYAVFPTETGQIEDKLLETWSKIWKTGHETLGGERALTVDFEQFDSRDILNPARSRAKILVAVRRIMP